MTLVISMSPATQKVISLERLYLLRRMKTHICLYMWYVVIFKQKITKLRKWFCWYSDINLNIFLMFGGGVPLVTDNKYYIATGTAEFCVIIVSARLLKFNEGLWL